MHSKFRNLFLIGLLATVAATGCGNDNDDDDNNQVNTPAEVPTPTPTPGTSAFEWASVRIDHREDGVQPPPPGSCNGFIRFEVQADGDFRYRNPCDSTKNKSGELSANELGALDALMNGVSREEAASDEACTEFNDDFLRADHRLAMASSAGRRYSLYRQDDDRECYSGNPAEITAIRNSLYELQTKYSQEEI